MKRLLQNPGSLPPLYLIAMSAAAFALMGLDKWNSKRKGAGRVPERTFFLLAALGGSPGAICGMLFFRHKTRHWYFVVGLPAILAVQIALLIWLMVP